MQLHKAHGAGNDFVVMPDRNGAIDLTPAAVVALCDRRFGIGGDGVLRLAPADDAHVFMDYRNGGDGVPVEMCGNGLRVVAAHLVEHGWTNDRELRIGTRSGVRTAHVTTASDGTVVEVEVDMAPPSFALADSHVERTAAGLEVISDAPEGTVRLTVDGSEHDAVVVSMGNPHVVLATDDPSTAPVTTLGPAIERHPAFTQGANVEFVTAHGPRHIELRVWERGVGETLACGSGICAAIAAGVRAGTLDAGAPIQVDALGGVLHGCWDGGPDDSVMLTGPTVEVGEVVPTPALLAAARINLSGTSTSR